MSRELLILRHAKSDWDRDYRRDHDRPLSRRGIEAAAKIGRHLTEIGKTPDLILSSSALRALKTAELASEAGDWQCPIEVRSRLYEATIAAWLEEVAATPPEIERLLVTGHEPTCSAVIRRLTGATVRVVTAAFAAITVDSDNWASIGTARCELELMVRPKELA